MFHGTTLRAFLASTVLVAVPLLADAQMQPGTGASTAPRADTMPQGTMAQGATSPGANPPGTAATRALDRAAGTNISGANPQNADGTPGNPPGTAAERALDRAAGTNTSGAFPAQRDGTPGNPPGTAVGRAIERATDGTATQSTGGPVPMARPNVAGAPAATAAATAGMTGQFVERPRVSQIIGSRVYNENNDSIGDVDDVLLTQGGQGPIAVLQIGGFLGIGGRLVTIPLSDLQWNPERERWVLRGATREQLQQRPEFQYSQLRRS